MFFLGSTNAKLTLRWCQRVQTYCDLLSVACVSNSLMEGVFYPFDLPMFCVFYPFDLFCTTPSGGILVE